MFPKEDDLNFIFPPPAVFLCTPLRKCIFAKFLCLWQFSCIPLRENVQISKNDTIALIKHDQVENLTIVMPPDAENGKIICVKNFHIGDGSQGGNYIITVIAAPFQTPTNHVIDYKYSSLELKASTVASGLLSDVNETVRLMWYALDASWIPLNDSY